MPRRALAAAVLASALGCGGSPPAASQALIKAHRGASADAPENTLTAVKLAWQQGADAVEIDVHISADGHPVVIHDADTARVGGRPREVASQSLAELRELDVGRWRGSEFAGERIPTLSEVLATIPDRGTLFVEIKSGPAAVPTVLAAIRDSDHRGAVAIESASADVLDAVRRRDPARATYWTIGAPRRGNIPRAIDPAVVSSAAAAGYTGLAIDVAGISTALLSAARGAKLEVGVWTVDDPAFARTLVTKVRWIETNRPALLARALGRRPNTR